MTTSLESKLWLAVHLLYPNSSQAFDAYQAILQQSEKALAEDNKNSVFSKLIYVFDKIPAISSNLSFYEFEFEEIDQWKAIYKNSQKTQLVIFIGVLIFELKISEIAEHIKYSEDKAHFLFHQIFKKLAQTSSKLKYNEPVQLKKQSDLKVSYLFTYENLVDYCLDQLSTDDFEKVRLGLANYPALQTTQDEYLKIINQIQNLKVQRAQSVLSKEKSNNVLKFPSQEKPAWRHTKIFATFGVSLALVLVMLFHPRGLIRYLAQDRSEVVIQDVEIAPKVVPPPPQAAEPVRVAAQETTFAAKPVPVEAEPPHEENVSAVSQGGLFRGTLTVQDLDAVNKSMKEKLMAMGAVKAGEVELGWLKAKHLSYYHYTIPEKNVQQAAEFLKKMGRLTLKFENHPRLLAAGTKRFIIEVREQSAQ